MDLLIKPQIIVPDQIDFSRYLADTEQRDKIRPARDFLAETLHALMPMHERLDCPKLPFANAWVYFPPGKLTIWGGFNGSGKSLLQGQVMVQFALEGFRCCIASFEMTPGETLARMVRQHARKNAPDRQEAQAFLGQMADSLWFYDQQGSVKWRRLIAVVRYCAVELKMQHIVIDSLMKCVDGCEDYDGQKDFVNTLSRLAMELWIHIHLVVHMKKGERDRADERIPTRYDAKGVSEISDIPDTFLIAWRNKPKERARDAGEEVDAGDPDGLLICDKQRHSGGWEGRIPLWFEADSQVYRDRPMGRRA